MTVPRRQVGEARPAGPAFMRPPRSLFRSALERLLDNRVALAGLVVIGLVALAAALAAVITAYDPAKQDYNVILEGPSRHHLLGTDGLGRDTTARLIYGARTSLSVGVFTQLIVITVGVPIGLVAGYVGGKTDNLLMRLVDIVFAFPDLLLVILLRAIFGGSIYMVFLAIGLVNWTVMSRLVRGQVLSLKEQDFVLAARVTGASTKGILFGHLLPNAIGPMLVLVTFGVPRAIFTEAALSYIGIGVTPPTPSWGTMVQDGYSVIFAQPYPVLFPATAIGVLMMAFTFLGDGLRDALDPRYTD